MVSVYLANDAMKLGMCFAIVQSFRSDFILF